mmetsp:Transcript_16994/g.29997  ORF Transcript_16994/g.29997 Transcript_16994/m.29997 type:complete len:84 (+) Transcript_16994:122-373(+)
MIGNLNAIFVIYSIATPRSPTCPTDAVETQGLTPVLQKLCPTSQLQKFVPSQSPSPSQNSSSSLPEQTGQIVLTPSRSGSEKQ